MSLLELSKVDLDGKPDNRYGCSKLIDIIAVHGLNEHYTEAWTDPHTNISWIRDLLPNSVRVARVLTYGYNASASSFHGTGSVDRIQQHAHTLVAAIQADRSLENCSQRPIIFICHGLGGILVKKALVYSSTRTSKYVDHLYSVFVSTFAILFFGTPHNGMEKANWLVPSRYDKLQIIKKTCKESQLLSAVETGSESLQTITEEFSPLIRQFHIFFFWEEIQTTIGGWTGYVVEESSAAPLIDNTERAGIHENHFGMIKFSDTKSSIYRTVIEALLRYCRQAPPVISERWRHAEDSLARARSHEAFELIGTAFDVHNGNQPFHYQPKTFHGPRNKHFQIPQVVSSIFTGREDMSQLVEGSLLTKDESLIRRQKRYIIYGIGGSGKTQFCCKFAQDHREKFWGVFWIDATSAETAKHSFANIGKIGHLEATQNAGKHWLSHLEESWLLIINNADDPTMDLQDLFPEGERGHILVTTRNPNFRVHASAGSCEFKGLRKNESLVLLLKAAGVPSPWDSSTEEAGNKITDALGYLALALIQAGALILKKICGIKDYLEYYNQHRRRLSGASRPSNHTYSHEKYTMNSTWDFSLSSLELRDAEASKDATQILNIVAFFHFEHIRVDIFTRAIENRLKAFESKNAKSIFEKILQSVWDRFQPPPVLPEFLRQDCSRLDPYRVRRALHELRAFSLISYDGRDDSFSLHPVVHAWARDRFSIPEQAIWAHVALNTLAESILLPPDDIGEVNENFRRDILPHLDLCLAACPIRIAHSGAIFRSLRLPLTLCFQYTSLLTFRNQLANAAKCGYVYAERGRFKEGAALLSMTKDALSQSRGAEDELTLRATLALARTYWGLGRLAEAVALQELAVDVRTKINGPEHPDTLAAMNELGRSYWLNGQYHEALELQTLTMERSKTSLGGIHSDTLAAMDNLGVTLGSWHQYPESVAIHRKVLELRERSSGSTRLDTLNTMNNLAMALLDVGEPEEARDLMARVYEERKLKLGKEHPWTLWALCNLAKVYSQLGLLEEAEEMLLPGIAAAKRSLGDDHLGVLMGAGELARAYARQERFEEAVSLTRSTITRLEGSRGIEHPDTVYALWKLAHLFELQGMLGKAVEACELAVRRVDLRLTTKHPLGQKINCYLSRLKDGLQSSQSGLLE